MIAFCTMGGIFLLTVVALGFWCVLRHRQRRKHLRWLHIQYVRTLDGRRILIGCLKRPRARRRAPIGRPSAPAACHWPSRRPIGDGFFHGRKKFDFSMFVCGVGDLVGWMLDETNEREFRIFLIFNPKFKKLKKTALKNNCHSKINEFKNKNEA